MSEILDPSELRARLAAAKGESQGVESSVNPFDRYQYIRPLSEAAEGYISAVGSGAGFKLGIPSIDCVTRGFGVGHLIVVFGASHQGKSQLLLNGVHNNPDKRILWVTPDEPAELVMAKLAALTLGIDSETLEDAIRKNDNEMIAALRSVAVNAFPNLIVLDRALDRDALWQAQQEAADYFGAPLDLTVYDYLEQFPVGDTDFGGVSKKILTMKYLSTAMDHPLVVVHQSSRSAGELGVPLGVRGMRYGGENEATFALEVFRKMNDPNKTQFEREQLREQVSVNICKNKIPPCKKRIVDLHMDPDTGEIRDWHDRDATIRPLEAWRRSRNVTWVEKELPL